MPHTTHSPKRAPRSVRSPERSSPRPDAARRARIVIVILAASLAVLAPSVHARDLWGCEVLMCMANPEGPTAAASCVEPINRLRAHLRRGRSWPSCEEANSGSGGASLRPGSNFYEPCPAGTSALGAGERAVRFKGATPELYAIGIGEGEGTDPQGPHGAPGATGPVLKTCVARARGVVWLSDGEASFQATVYETIVQLAPGASPAYVDVTVAGQTRRVRY